MNAGAGEHVGGDSDLSPRLVLDALPLAILGRYDDESLFERLDVDDVDVLGIGEAPVEVTSLLDEMRPLERVGRSDLGVDLTAASGEGLGAHLATAARLVLFEGFEIPADGIALAPAFREGVLVLVTESRLALGLSFPGRHATSVAATDAKCNSSPIKIVNGALHHTAKGDVRGLVGSPQ